MEFDPEEVLKCLDNIETGSLVQVSGRFICK